MLPSWSQRRQGPTKAYAFPQLLRQYVHDVEWLRKESKCLEKVCDVLPSQERLRLEFDEPVRNLGTSILFNDDEIANWRLLAEKRNRFLLDLKRSLATLKSKVILNWMPVR